MVRTYARASLAPVLRGAALVALATLTIIGAASFAGQLGGEQRVDNVEVFPVYDTSDPRRVVGRAENVFVGRVVENRGDGGLYPDLPTTRFLVEPGESIKGTLNGAVTLHQMGGYDADGTLVTFEDDPLLVPGETYLFLARRDPRGDTYQLIAPGVDNVRVEGEQHRREVVRKYRNAYGEEIPFDPATP